jgi:4-hydroxyphenylpyruvate dioxygenase
MGFPAVARHKRKDVTLHTQGEINFIINAEPGSYAESFARDHGPSACAMAFRVKDAKFAHRARGQPRRDHGPDRVAKGEMDIPAIEGIGGSRLFLVDHYGDKGSIYDVDFDFFPDWQQRMAELDSRLTYIDHLTHNVNRGQMSVWAGYYERLFNFREIRYFDIEGNRPASSRRP